MLQLEQTVFYRRYGVRNLGQLMMPRMFNLENWTLPINSIFHYIPMSALDLGPDGNFFPIKGSPKKPYLYTVTEMLRKEGMPRVRGGINVLQLEKNYIRKHPEFRRVLNLERALDEPKVPMVANYGLIPIQYKYPPMPLARWHRFQNIMATVYGTIQRLLEEGVTRDHYIVFGLPEQIPLRSQLVRAVESADFMDIFSDATEYLKTIVPTSSDQQSSTGEVFEFVQPGIFDNMPEVSEDAFDESSLGFGEISFSLPDTVSNEAMSQMVLKFFQDDLSLTLADLWKWLSENREESLLGVIDPNKLNKINFIFTESGKFSVINLGVLDGFRADKATDKQGMSFGALSKNMATYFSSMSSLRSMGDPTKIIQTIPEDEDEPVTLTTQGGEGSNVITPEQTASAIEKPVLLGAVKVTSPLVQTPTVVKSVLGQTKEPVEIPHSVSIPVAAPEESPEPIVVDNNPLTAEVERSTRDLLSKGVMSVAERRRLLKLAERYKEIPAPFGEGTLEDFTKIPKELIWDFKPGKIPDLPHVLDKSMLESTLLEYDPVYLEKVFQKDVARMALSFQRGGFAVTGYEVERKTDALNKLWTYRLKVTPVKGVSSTVNWQLPVIDKSGKYKVNGVKYFMRKLRTDKPIRKINPFKVSLSTYYPNKLSVERSVKNSDNYGEWLQSGMRLNILSKGATITRVVYGNVAKPGQDVPRTYSAIAGAFIEFELQGIHFFFDYANLTKNFEESAIKVSSSKDRIPVGKRGNGVIDMDSAGQVYEGENPLGHIATLWGADIGNRPVETVTVSVLDAAVPLGILLCYTLGMKKVLSLIGEPDRRRVKGTKRDTGPDEFEIVFEDEIWVFPRNNSVRTLIWGSLNQWKRVIRNTPVSDLESQENFFILFSTMDLNARHLREIDILSKLFLDPISIDVLESMPEPTEFNELLIKAAFYLVTDNYPDEGETSESLIKGYERMAGAVYRSMCRSIRQYNSNPNRAKASLDVNPYDVLLSIQGDPSVSLTEESNPIHNLKEKQNVTFSGVGGRSKRSMVRRTRAFHQSDIGVRSESTVDSGDVGINTYLTANPNLTSLYGTVQGLDPTKAGAAQMLSSAALVSPFATYDDGKRVNFIPIQQDHAIASSGTRASPIRTGEESVFAHQVDDIFATTAKADGKITEKTDTHVTFTPDDPKIPPTRVEIGRLFGTVTGKTVPHSLTCDLEIGQKIKAGTVFAFNTGFFERDWRNPSNVVWKSGVPSYLALLENNDTFEDSSRISRKLAGHLVSNVSHVRTIMTDFDQHVHQLVKVGDTVDIEDVLCYIEDAVTGDNAMFDEETIDNLKRLSTPAPRAKYIGKVEKIEVIYFGDKEDMSSSLAKIATQYDNLRAKQVKALDSDEAKTGRISSPARIDGLPIDMDMMAIRIFITGQNGMGDGDKLVVGNQLKSVITGVIEGKFETELPIFKGGEPIQLDAEFSYRAINARIVNSPILMGIGNILLESIGREMAANFFERK